MKYEIFFGPIAGVVEAFIMQPIDTIKNLKQSNQYKGLFNTNVKNLYKGLLPFTTQMSLKYFLRFYTFNKLKSKENNDIKNFGAGLTAGFIESLLITPFELIKTNLQTSNNKYPLIVVKDIYNKNGIKGLYKGFVSTAIRQCINQSFNFTIYYKLRNKFIDDKEKPNIFKIASSALISSSIGPILNNPFDVIKTRYQNPKYNYPSLKYAANDIIKNDGFRMLWKGIELRLLRVSGGQVITFLVIENLTYNFNEYYK
jgi:hypothetical protein